MTKEQIFSTIAKAVKGVPELFCDDQAEYFRDELYDAKLPFSWSFVHGISKAALLISGSPYVIKFPFTHIYDDDAYIDAHYEWEELKDDMYERAWTLKKVQLGEDALPPTRYEVEMLLNEEIPAEPDDYQQFCYPLEGAAYYAPKSLNLDDVNDWNYCHLECAIYQEAVKQGLGQYFAEEGLLGYLQDGHPVYYQQRCIALCDMENYDWNSDEYQRRSTSAHKTCEKLNTYCFNSWWIADFIDMYGEEEFKVFSDFLREMQIDDLRDCNVGYLDGAPILFDYSGFRQWD